MILLIVDKLLIAILIATFAFFGQRLIERYKATQSIREGTAKERVTQISIIESLLADIKIKILELNARFLKLYNEEIEKSSKEYSKEIQEVTKNTLEKLEEAYKNNTIPDPEIMKSFFEKTKLDKIKTHDLETDSQIRSKEIGKTLVPRIEEIYHNS